MNGTAVDMLGGRSSAEFIGECFHTTVIAPEYKERTLEMERRLLRGDRGTMPPMEVRLRRRCGGELDVLISSTSWLEADEMLVESMLVDITALKQRERLLKTISELMTITIEHDPLAATRPTLHQAIKVIHELYTEPHNCGSINFSRLEDDSSGARGRSFLSEIPTLMSYEPLFCRVAPMDTEERQVDCTARFLQ